MASALERSNKGSKLHVTGTRAFGGLQAMLIFRNALNKVDGPHRYDETVKASLSLIDPVVVPKQGSLGGPGGNPLIWLSFATNIETIGDPVFLGRCNKLGA